MTLTTLISQNDNDNCANAVLVITQKVLNLLSLGIVQIYQQEPVKDVSFLISKT